MNACDKNILLVRGNFFSLIVFINVVNCRKFCMHIGKVAQKSVLLSKTLGVKRGASFLTEDTFKFINKRGEDCVFTVFRDGNNKVVRNRLQNITQGTEKERLYSYRTYTFEDGKTVPYTIVQTKHSDGTREKEIISTVQNGAKVDVTKSQLIQTTKDNGNKLEESSVLRFSNGKKPAGVYSTVEKDANDEILSKKTVAQNSKGKQCKIIPDLFYSTPVYGQIDLYRNIFKMLKFEMGLQNYGIKAKSVHLGYNKDGHYTRAKYNHNSKTVSLNVDVPIVNERGQFSSEVALELFHAWQYREVELLEKGLLSGSRKEAAEVYKHEFSNYVPSSKNYKAYRVQTVESKARDFQKFVKFYFSRNMKNIYNKYAKGIIPPQIGINYPVPEGELKKVL